MLNKERKIPIVQNMSGVYDSYYSFPINFHSFIFSSLYLFFFLLLLLISYSFHLPSSFQLFPLLPSLFLSPSSLYISVTLYQSVLRHIITYRVHEHFDQCSSGIQKSEKIWNFCKFSPIFSNFFHIFAFISSFSNFSARFYIEFYTEFYIELYRKFYIELSNIADFF